MRLNLTPQNQSCLMFGSYVETNMFEKNDTQIECNEYTLEFSLTTTSEITIIYKRNAQLISQSNMNWLRLVLNQNILTAKPKCYIKNHI